jgi:hypothetical protein
VSYGRLLGVASALVLAADGPMDADVDAEFRIGVGVGIAPTERLGSTVLAALLWEAVWDGRVEVGLALGLGAIDADGVGVTDGLLAGGGASGTVGDVGAPWVVRRNGRATRTATVHVTPAPAAARSSLRRAAPRRIAS